MGGDITKKFLNSLGIVLFFLSACSSQSKNNGAEPGPDCPDPSNPACADFILECSDPANPDCEGSGPLRGDVTAPICTLISPANGSIDVLTTSLIIVSCNEAMDSSTMNSDTFTVTKSDGTGSVSGSINSTATTTILDPDPNLDYDTNYRIAITTGAKDLAGNPLTANIAWAFKTVTAPPGGEGGDDDAGDADDDDEPDGLPLTIVATEPGNGASGLPVNVVVGINFSERPEPATINRDTVLFYSSDGRPIEWVGGSRGSSYDLMPLNNLRHDTQYIILLTPGVTDSEGNPLESPYFLNFRTRPAPLVTAVSSGALHSAAVMSDGTVRTCGYSAGGRLGYSTDESANPLAGGVNGLSNVVKVCAGSNHSVALTVTGGLWAWGANDHCQLGVAGGESSETPTRVGFLLKSTNRITDIACGESHTLALDSRGRVYAWGRGDSGQLGNGNDEDSCSPVLTSLPGSLVIDQIAAGMSHSVALSREHNVYTWGNNDRYQAGFPSGLGSNTPREVPGVEDIIHIAAGLYHTMASGGSGLFGWGDNRYGQVDHGFYDRSSIREPEFIPFAGGTIGHIAAGEAHTMVLSREDGDVWVWGGNTYSQLARTFLKVSNYGPFEISLPAQAISISAGGSHNLVLLEDGGAISWGRNNFGQLCREAENRSSIPTLIDWFE